ncbi:MAG TPA: hypothetical protein VFT22_18080 [Kofleriaceae bacterium]|nr:hypothetical protein [Kofleriaceae bacterium]
MADHIVRRVPASSAPQPHERRPTTELAGSQLQRLIRAHDEPDPLEVTAVATIAPYGSGGPDGPAGLANGSSTRLAHTVPREPRGGAARPAGRGDIATITMPQLDRGIPRLYDHHDDHHDDHPTTTMPALSAAALVARSASDSSSGPRARATRDESSALTAVDELAARRAEARRSQPRPVEPRQSGAMRTRPHGEHAPVDPDAPSAALAPSVPGPSIAAAPGALPASSVWIASEAPGARVRRNTRAPRWPVLRRSARSRLVVPVGLLIVLGSAAAVLVRAIF